MIEAADATKASPLAVSQWFNSAQPITLDALRGKVVLIHAFQMLCPACAMRSTPQAVRRWQYFLQSGHDNSVAVIGLHTVFEHQ